jgi:hypothetical protein
LEEESRRRKFDAEIAHNLRVLARYDPLDMLSRLGLPTDKLAVVYTLSTGHVIKTWVAHR